MDTRTEKVLEIEEAISNFEERFQRILISKRKVNNEICSIALHKVSPFNYSHSCKRGSVTAHPSRKATPSTVVVFQA